MPVIFLLIAAFTIINGTIGDYHAVLKGVLYILLNGSAILIAFKILVSKKITAVRIVGLSLMGIILVVANTVLLINM